jgi:hypothetical protein
MLFAINVKCQTVALNMPSSNQEFTSYSRACFAAYHPHRDPPGAMTIIGGCSIPIGVFLALYGLLDEYGAYWNTDKIYNAAEWDRGNREVFAGCATIVAGIGVCIAGGIRDHKMHLRDRYGRYPYSIIAPKNNEIGLAYKF